MSTPSETPAATLITPEVAELIALGAAMAGNCEEAFQTHHHRLHQCLAGEAGMRQPAGHPQRHRQQHAQGGGGQLN